MSMVNTQQQQQQHIIRYAFFTLLIRMIPILRHKPEAEALQESVHEIQGTLERERAEHQVLLTQAKEMEVAQADERQSFQARVVELEAFQAQVLRDRQIERFAVRQEDDGLFWVRTNVCPQCHTHHGGTFHSENFEKARTSAEYLNEAAHCGVKRMICEACSSDSEKVQV